MEGRRQLNVINVSMSDAKGIDIGANYRRPLGQGTLSLGLRGSYLMQFETTTLPGVSSSVQFVVITPAASSCAETTRTRPTSSN